MMAHVSMPGCIMVCMKRAIFSLVMLAGMAAAETFSGTVMDVMCRAKDPANHTRECAINCAKSGYGLVTADGKFLKFDAAGNKRTLAALKKSTKEKDLKVNVTGKLDKDVLKVESIDLLP